MQTDSQQPATVAKPEAQGTLAATHGSGETHKLPLNIIRLVLQAENTQHNREQLSKAAAILKLNLTLEGHNVLKREQGSIIGMEKCQLRQNEKSSNPASTT